uniref:G protein gamma domain-containing protein n=1 Tax=Steinernema glaseri TaxID=37863 RepID=A0A1I8AU49_9BILA
MLFAMGYNIFVSCKNTQMGPLRSISKQNISFYFVLYIFETYMALHQCHESAADSCAADMEHRTKREAPPKDLSEHVLKAKNLQQLVETIEGYSSDKERDRVKQPPPVRIVPFSGMKPQVGA